MELARRAIEANPNSAMAHERLARAALVGGYPEVCLEQSDKMLSLSPLDPKELTVKGFKAFAYFSLGQYEQSLAARRSVKLPQRLNINFQCIEAMNLLKLGRLKEAEASITQVLAKFPHLSITFIRNGNRNYAEKSITPWLATLRELGVPEG
jgi:tetratricopeptide (TPR) repeat protein